MAETGHARNIEHFSQLISFCQGYGVTYNPTNGDLTVAKLQALLATAQANVASVATAVAPWKTAAYFSGVSHALWRRFQRLISCWPDSHS